MMRVAVGLVSALIVVATMAAFAPAALIDARIAAMSDGAVRLADAEGAWWCGRGVLAARDGAWRIPLAWRVSPSSLWRGVVDVTLASFDGEAPMPRGRFQIRSAQLRGHELALTVPSTALVAATGLSAVRLGGEIVLTSDAFAFGEVSDGKIGLEWRNARVASPALPPVDLGTVSASLSAQGESLSGPIVNRGGEFRVGGQLAVARRRTSVEIELLPDAGTPEDTRRVLAALGRSDARGAVRFSFETAMR